ncbi:antibiotic biosynthesis monooxygenase [Nocardioides sp. NPDC087217]|uniref:antibiotic biosynthesis monooxygenase n=1 Tax=Nocardioides sp. NPDC087217 TaxID=3364335 RepID=UPI00381C9F92
MTTHQNAEGPATLTIRRTVHPGREREFETEFAEVLAAAAAMPGWVGGSVLAVGTGPAEYDARLHFASQDALDEWVRSDTRRAWLERLEVLSDQATVARLGAQDAWLVPPHIVPIRPPPRYKVAMLTWLGIYPLITAILAIAGPHIAHLPVFVRSLILTATVIPLMTWWVMPLLTRVTSTWLHGQDADPIRRDRQPGLTEG